MEKIRDRVLRTARTLEAAGIPYAVVGGNAVADWVSRVDEAAVRNTRDVGGQCPRYKAFMRLPARPSFGR